MAEVLEKFLEGAKIRPTFKFIIMKLLWDENWPARCRLLADHRGTVKISDLKNGKSISYCISMLHK